MYLSGNLLPVAEMVGVAGFGLYVLTYAMLTFRFVSGNSVAYFGLNLMAAVCVLIGLIASFNLASAMIQIFWITMSTIGITLQLTRSTPR
ncbi:hypothetical protein [uncultured Sulfitobacter sp.]|uniref:CBU_0592 family membrane protein n=1 Tax=uncultured Sulfitobacter sp. TaxID=191468 RepID=UPI002608908E|nr:hypothetical protein [uncultured Sulfitobacter sp.]